MVLSWELHIKLQAGNWKAYCQLIQYTKKDLQVECAVTVTFVTIMVLFKIPLLFISNYIFVLAEMSEVLFHRTFDISIFRGGCPYLSEPFNMRSMFQCAAACKIPDTVCTGFAFSELYGTCVTCQNDHGNTTVDNTFQYFLGKDIVGH